MIFSFFWKILIGGQLRVLKLHRGFILTKKGDINPQNNLETPWPGPLGGCFRFFRFFVVENFKSSYGSETLDMTSEGLGEMFDCDSADMCGGKCPLVLMGGRA